MRLFFVAASIRRRERESQREDKVVRESCARADMENDHVMTVRRRINSHSFLGFPHWLNCSLHLCRCVVGSSASLHLVLHLAHLLHLGISIAPVAFSSDSTKNLQIFASLLAEGITLSAVACSSENRGKLLAKDCNSKQIMSDTTNLNNSLALNEFFSPPSATPVISAVFSVNWSLNVLNNAVYASILVLYKLVVTNIKTKSEAHVVVRLLHTAA
ncbi:hypothetical protein VNO77_22026 [Canavalia gladiata]|uniref:Uncharacterized protein n=1 Tax=Canavalia gladiata TaxID=3824 RepID=A0AAN9QE44_CANGL